MTVSNCPVCCVQSEMLTQNGHGEEESSQSATTPEELDKFAQRRKSIKGMWKKAVKTLKNDKQTWLVSISVTVELCVLCVGLHHISRHLQGAETGSGEEGVTCPTEPIQSKIYRLYWGKQTKMYLYNTTLSTN